MTLVTVDVFKVYYSKFRIIKKNLLDLSNVVWYLFVFPSFEIFKIKIILNDLKIYIYIFSRFKYYIKSGARGHFQIDGSTGKITTKASLDREAIPSYQLSIVAQDENEKCHKGLMVLDVPVGDANDNKPKFDRQYIESVREDASLHQRIVQVCTTYFRGRICEYKI